MTDIKLHLGEIKEIKLSELKPRTKNRNNHTDEQIDRLASLYKYQGFRNPIIVSNQSGEIVCGTGRYLAAKKAGMEYVPVLFQDYENSDQEYAHHVADNSLGLWSELDLSSIQIDALDLGPDFELNNLGIEDFFLPNVTEDKSAIEDVIPDNAETRCKLGDVWLLGDHRLMCGDSTSIDAVEKLMNGEKADMVFTDPPYGVDYDGGTTKRKKLENDHSTDIYSDVLPMLVASTNDKAPFYIWHAAGYADMAHKINENGLQIRSQIIWNKNQAQFGALSAQYKQKHEPCFYCHKKGCPPIWEGPTNEVTVWDMKRESKNEFHPTQKPVELAERALNNHNPKSVLDLFGGSGSTLIACEKTNRKCFMMELDPHYCDVILTRFEKYTGKVAELAE